MVVNIKNPSKIVLNEIQEWLSSKGYRCGYCFVVNLVYLNVSSKISPKDVAEFKKEFGEDIHLKGASYGANGSTSHFKYWCDHHLLDEFGNSIRNWLANQNLRGYFTVLSDGISLEVYDELYDNQIKDFEEEFEVKFKKYSISCNSDRIDYEFNG